MNNVLNAGFKNRNLLTFSWDIIKVCQYRCDYCYAFDILEKKMDKRLINLYKLILLKLKKVKYDFNVELLGGEPTMHPKIEDILRTLQRNKNCKAVELVTNVAKPVSFYKQFDSENYNKTLIAASYHPQYDNNNRYAKKCIEISKFDHLTIYCNINLPKEKEQWDKIKNTLDLLTDNNVNLGLNFIHSVKDKYDTFYGEDFKLFFKDYLSNNKKVSKKSFPYNINGKVEMLDEHHIRMNNLFKFYNYTCTPLMYSIDAEGNINNACSGEKFDNFDNIIKTFKCPIKEGCNCDILFNYYKEK